MTDYESGVALMELPTPEPEPNELLVRVRASSVYGIDVLVAGGVLKGMMEYEFPAVPGRGFAGTVEEVGSNVELFEVGDEVFGFLTKPTVHEGAWADHVTVPEDGFVARKPGGLDFTEAAALPLAGVTALLAVDAVDPHQADAVLVVGADGGVASYAVQLAAKRSISRGAHDRSRSSRGFCKPLLHLQRLADLMEGVRLVQSKCARLRVHDAVRTAASLAADLQVSAGRPNGFVPRAPPSSQATRRMSSTASRARSSTASATSSTTTRSIPFYATTSACSSSSSSTVRDRSGSKQCRSRSSTAAPGSRTTRRAAWIRARFTDACTALGTEVDEEHGRLVVSLLP